MNPASPSARAIVIGADSSEQLSMHLTRRDFPKHQTTGRVTGCIRRSRSARVRFAEWMRRSSARMSLPRSGISSGRFTPRSKGSHGARAGTVKIQDRVIAPLEFLELRGRQPRTSDSGASRAAPNNRLVRSTPV
jgi:hypothetical protein